MSQCTVFACSLVLAIIVCHAIQQISAACTGVRVAHVAPRSEGTLESNSVNGLHFSVDDYSACDRCISEVPTITHLEHGSSSPTVGGYTITFPNSASTVNYNLQPCPGNGGTTFWVKTIEKDSEWLAYYIGTTMLVDIPLEKIQPLCSILEKELPLSMEAINHMKRYHIWKKNEDTCGMRLLYAEDDEESGVFVKVYKGYLLGPVLNVYALDGYEHILRDKLFAWNFTWPKKIVFDYLLPKYVPLVEELTKMKNYELKSSVKLKCFTMSIETALKLEIEIPDDVEFGPLPLSHLEEIHRIWLSKNMYGIETLNDWYNFDKKYAVALFSRTDGSILSSCLRSYNGGFAALQTAPSARGKGYGTLLVKKVSKMLAEDSIEPYYETSERNTSSLAVARKIGFEHAYDCFSFVYEKSNNEE